MKNQEKGFSPEPEIVNPKGSNLAKRDEATLRNEFEIMKRLDFVLIKELGASTAEEYMIEITRLACSSSKRGSRKHMA